MKSLFQFATGFTSEHRLLFLIIIVISLHIAVFFHLKSPLIDDAKKQVNDLTEKNVLVVTMFKRRTSESTAPASDNFAENELTRSFESEQIHSASKNLNSSLNDVGFVGNTTVSQNLPQSALTSYSANTPKSAPANTPTSSPKEKPSITSKNKRASTATQQNVIAQERNDFSTQESTPVYVSQPRFKDSRPQPNYPQHARRMRQDGVVIIRVVIAKSGRVIQADVHQSSGSESLDAAAKEASLLAQFYPYLIDGVAHTSQADLPFKFVLK